MTGRTQTTMVDVVFSVIGNQKFGVPQGSVLSGLLFSKLVLTAYVTVYFKGNEVVYADDTALFIRLILVTSYKKLCNMT